MDLHDYCIKGIKLKANTLYLLAHSEDEVEEVVCIFHEVKGWNLSPFEEQNIIFGLVRYEKSQLTSSIIEYYEIDDNYISLLDDRHHLFVLTSSVGMGGYVIANHLDIVSHIDDGLNPL